MWRQRERGEGVCGSGKGGAVPSRHSMSKWDFKKRDRRASCTVWTVAFEPEPWKARRVGFLGVDIVRCVSEDLVARVGGESDIRALLISSFPRSNRCVRCCRDYLVAL
jgi:hypothetical protein